MSTNFDTFSVTDLRHQTNKVLKKASDVGYVYVIKNSKTKAVIADVDYFRALREAYEDYLDTLEFDRTINLKRVPLEKHKKSYQRKQNK